MKVTQLSLLLGSSLLASANPVPAPAPEVAIIKSDNTAVGQPLIQGPQGPTVDVKTLQARDFVDAEGPEFEAHRLVARAPSYQQLVLNHHNVHRANHSAGNLVSNYALAVYASQWANQCNFAHNTSIGGGGYGQNIYAGSTNVGDAITSSWYNSEVNNFLPSYYGQATPDLSNFGSYGHFTQIVWKGTTSVGCWTTDCRAKGLKGVNQYVPPYFTVCNYGPAGNYLGSFGSNVGKPLGKPSVNGAYQG